MNFDEKKSTTIIAKHIELSADSYSIRHKRHQKIECNNGNILFLKEGSISIYKNTDNLLLIELEAPAIIGLSTLYEKSDPHYIRCESDCKFTALHKTKIINIIEKRNLWRQSFEILMWYQLIYLQREIMTSHSNIYDLVKNHIKYIWALPEDTRRKISIYDFIISRNHISRSAIHKAIQEMCNCNLVEVNRGKLIHYKGSTSSE